MRPSGVTKGKPRGIRHDRDCRNCRRRGVKCDLNRPQCLPCVQSGFLCGGYPQRIVWASERISVQSGLSSAISITAQAATAPIAGYWCNDPETVRFNILRRLMMINEKAKSSLDQQHIVSSPNDNVTCASQVWDFACKKLELYADKAPSQNLTADMTHLYVAALREVNKAIGKANPIALFGIATFAYFEVCDGSFGRWQCHLNGALSLLDVHCQSRKDLDRLSQDLVGLKEIVANLVWFDTMGTLIRGDGQLIFRGWHRDLLREGFYSVVGCPSDAFELFVAVARGETQLQPMEYTFKAISQLLELGYKITEKDQAADAWRCTAAIAVLSAVETKSSLARQNALSLAVGRVCEIVSKISPTSRFFIHMAAAVYLAGINAGTEEQRGIVRKYWKTCQTSGMSHYPDAHRLCEQRWTLESRS